MSLALEIGRGLASRRRWASATWMPGWLRDVLRLQTAEVDLALRRDECGPDRLVLERGRLGLSGGE